MLLCMEIIHVIELYEQRDLLLEEDVCFKDNGNVDMKKCKWQLD